MFNKLRNRIIIITMAITTVVLVLSGLFIMFFWSSMRPEPKPQESDISISVLSPVLYDRQELKFYIENDRREGSERLLSTLLCVGISIEVITFIIVYCASRRMVEPVKDSYDKQKLFIANASHELKTPLAVIQANMDALEVSKDDEKWKTNIEDEINHANKLVLDLLELAKMDAGEAKKVKPEDVDLQAEIKKRVKIFKPKFSGKISFKNTSERKTVSLPKQDILQVLDILLDNATKYGEKKVSVTLSKNCITVSNDGATISEEDQERIFDRFYQTDKTKNGSGLGLAIAKALCEQNDWSIHCESANNLTHFVVKL